MTLSPNGDVVKTVKSMMMGSWQTCVNYMTPLGLYERLLDNSLRKW